LHELWLPATLSDMDTSRLDDAHIAACDAEAQAGVGRPMEARFAVLVEQEMLAHGLNPDDPRDLNIYLRAKLAELKSREH
jgi:hypothetical protein